MIAMPALSSAKRLAPPARKQQHSSAPIGRSNRASLKYGLAMFGAKRSTQLSGRASATIEELDGVRVITVARAHGIGIDCRGSYSPVPGCGRRGRSRASWADWRRQEESMQQCGMDVGADPLSCERSDAIDLIGLKIPGSLQSQTCSPMLRVRFAARSSSENEAPRCLSPGAISQRCVTPVVQWIAVTSAV